MVASCVSVLEKRKTHAGRRASGTCHDFQHFRHLHDCPPEHMVKRFFNSLQDRNWDEFVYQLGLLLVLATISLLLFANQKFLCSKTVLIWRQWLSDNYTRRWLSSKCYYRELFYKRIDNPDQRIAEDMKLFPKLTISMIFDFINSFGSFGAYVVILWNLSESYEIFGIVIPGIMLWLAVGFVIIGTWMVHKIGHPLISLERRNQNMKPITALPCSVSAKSKRNRFLRRRRQGDGNCPLSFQKRI